MAKTVHVVLIVIGIMLGLIVCVVALGYLWWRHNGSAFARHASDHSASLVHQVNEQMFFEGCLRWSRVTPGLCDTIPSGHGVKDVLRFATWSVDQCRRRGLQDSRCPNVFKPLQHDCERRTAAEAK